MKKDLTKEENHLVLALSWWRCLPFELKWISIMKFKDQPVAEEGSVSSLYWELTIGSVIGYPFCDVTKIDSTIIQRLYDLDNF